MYTELPLGEMASGRRPLAPEAPGGYENQGFAWGTGPGPGRWTRMQKGAHEGAARTGGGGQRLCPRAQGAAACRPRREVRRPDPTWRAQLITSCTTWASTVSSRFQKQNITFCFWCGVSLPLLPAAAGSRTRHTTRAHRDAESNYQGRFRYRRAHRPAAASAAARRGHPHPAAAISEGRKRFGAVFCGKIAEIPAKKIVK